MAEYQLTANDNAVIKKAAPPDAPYDLYVPNDPGNKDWQEYQRWLADGGVPDPYVPPPEPEPVPPPTELTDTMLFAHENRIRALEGRPPLTVDQFKASQP